MSALFDRETLFHRIRQWSPSGIGAMTMSCVLHQMGGRPGIDPFGWQRDRIYAAMHALQDEGSIEKKGPCGEYVVTPIGIERYEGPSL